MFLHCWLRVFSTFYSAFNDVVVPLFFLLLLLWWVTAGDESTAVYSGRQLGVTGWKEMQWLNWAGVHGRHSLPDVEVPAQCFGLAQKMGTWLWSQWSQKHWIYNQSLSRVQAAAAVQKIAWRAGTGEGKSVHGPCEHAGLTAVGKRQKLLYQSTAEIWVVPRAK